MPIYEYECKACGHTFDMIQSFSEEPLIDCPVCKEPALKKLISASAFHLKGSGWYVTDFKNPPTKADKTEKTKTEEASSKPVEANKETHKETHKDSKVKETEVTKSVDKTTSKTDKSDKKSS
ncbi:MAG: zinc ribbon domain-containing protein [Candidatus Aquirickettsiella sp.]